MATKKAVKKKVPAKKAPAKKVNARRNAVGDGLHPESKLAQVLGRRTEENLTLPMKWRRDTFVTEYLYDFNASKAWRRMKAQCDPDDTKEYTSNQSAEFGYQLTREPYVALKIRETIDAMEEANFLNRNRILAMALREANFTGIGAQHGGRVSSIKLLADIAGLGSAAKAAARAPGGGQGAGTPRGGVMIVPATDTVASWEKKAMAAQQQLKEDVRK